MQAIVETINAIDENSKKIVFKHFDQKDVNVLQKEAPGLVEQLKKVKAEAEDDMFLEVDTEAIESDSSGNQSENDKINQIQHIQRLSVGRESMKEQVQGRGAHSSPSLQPQNGVDQPANASMGYLSVQRNGHAEATGQTKSIGKSPATIERQLDSNGGHEGGASDVSVSKIAITISPIF